MIRKTRVLTLLLAGVLFSLALPGEKREAYGSQPSFYLATDRSFGSDEVPYVNLEGPGQSYEFRIYGIENPEEFLLGKIKERLVKEKRARAFADPVNLFKNTVQYFRDDLRKVARNELNVKTRSGLRASLGMDSIPYQNYYQLSEAGIMRNHKFLTSFTLPASKPAWSYQRVPIPVKEKGLYLVEVVKGSDSAYTLINRTGINFVSKQGDDQTMLFVADRTTGKPISGAAVKILNASTAARIAATSTDDRGVATFKGATPSRSLILVSKNGEFALSDPDFYARSFYGKGGPRVYLYTDRPVYRPGDEVNFKGILRSFDRDSYRILSGGATVDVLTEEGGMVQKNLPVAISSDVGTFYGKFTLPESSYMGPHQIVLNFQNKSYSAGFIVEAYKKPTFLVKVSTPSRIYESQTTVPVKVKARYYHGQPVTGGSVTLRIFRKPKYAASPVGTLNFDAAADYLGISEVSDKQELVHEANGKLNGEGLYQTSFGTGEVDRDYHYSVIATVTLPAQVLSGSTGFSVNRSQFYLQVDRESMVYEPGGKAPFTIKLIPFDHSLSKEKRKEVVGNKKIRATLYERDFYRISEEKERKKVGSAVLHSDENGIVKANFILPKKGHYMIHVEAEDSKGHPTSTDVGLWASEKNDSIQVPFKNLTLQPGKDLYENGEVAEVLVMSPVSDGYLFLTLEGNRIYKHETIKMKGNTLKYRIRIDPSFMPNFTLSALQFSGNDVYKSQVKIVAPPVEKFLKVELSPKKKTYKPGETAEVAVHTGDRKGRGVPAEISVSVVDAAIYQIQPDRSPPITTFFYHPRRNNINTTMASAYRFFGYSESKRLELALRGRTLPPLSSLKDGEEESREDFKDTAYWQATLRTDKNGRALVKIPLPDNLTTWRVDVRAVTGDTKVGQGRTSFISSKNIMVKPGIPSYMIRGEKQKVAASVTNLTGAKMETTVQIQAEGGEVVGEKSRKLSLDPGTTSILYFTVNPTEENKTREMKIRMTARNKAGADTVDRTVPLNYFGRSDSVASGLYFSDKNGKATADLTLPDRYQDPALEVLFSPGSGAALRESLSYLADYPYGCVEQTMSRFMPLLAARKAGYTNPRLKKELPLMVSEGLQRLKSLQNYDGGYTWFGNSKSDPLMSAYVYRGLAISKKLGSPVPSEMINRTRKYLYSSLGNSSPSPILRAYILFSLSEGGRVESSMVNKLTDLLPNQKEYGQALTALTLVNSGETDRAREIFEALKDRTKLGKKEEILFTSLGNRAETFEEDRVELTSAMLLLAVRLNEDAVVAERLATTLILNRDGIAWKNSRDTAMAVLALSEKLENMLEKEGDSSEITVKVNGREVYTGTVSPKEIYEGKLSRIPMRNAELKAKNIIEITKNGGASLYATAVLNYFNQSDSFRKQEKGFSISRSYYKMKSERKDGNLTLEASGQNDFLPGDLVMVELKVRAQADRRKYVMVEDTLPPGFSVEKKDKEYYSGERKIEYNGREIFDDRASFFVENPTGEFTIRYFLRAEIPGKYRVNPAVSSLMYFPHVRGTTDDATLVVKED